MKVPFLSLKVKYAKRKKILNSIDKILESGKIINEKSISELEKKICLMTGYKYSVCVGSGSSAIFLALKALGIQKGDEVITTPFSWIITSNAISSCGAKPVFVDVDNNFNLNPDKISRAVTKKTKAILPVNINGKLCDVQKIYKIAKKFNLKVIYDSAQSFGTVNNKINIENFSDASAYSFNPMKILHGYGEAGAISTNDKKIYDSIKMLRHAGKNRDKNNNDDVNVSFFNSLNHKMDTIQSAIILENLNEIKAIIKKRNKIANIYKKELKKFAKFQITNNSEIMTYYQFYGRFQRRNELRLYLKRKGVETKIFYSPLICDAPLYKSKKNKTIRNARKISKEIIALPMHESLSFKQINYVVKQIRKFYEEIKQISYRRSDCRICNNKKIKKVLNLGSSPISEKYVNKYHLYEQVPNVPIDLYFCENCKHLQMLDVVDPDYLWSNLTFKTSRNIKLIKHFKKYTKKIINLHTIGKKDLIIDVGSNDGTLLNEFKKLGYKNILGIDPASEIVEAANKNGIRSIDTFLNKDSSNKILKKYGKARLITANYVFAHVDNLKGMLSSIKTLMDKKSLYVFEVSYVLDVVKKKMIGTIFHEHLSYHSVTSLKYLLNKLDMDLIKVDRNPEQGGSIVCYAKLKNSKKNKIFNSVHNLIKLEEHDGINTIERYKKFDNELRETKTELHKKIKKLYDNKKVISCFGAARSGSTFLSYYNLSKFITKIYDDNEEKHYQFSPGNQIQVFPTKDIYKDNPDYLIILAWIQAEKIIKNYTRYTKNGGTFVSLHPTLKFIKKRV